MDRAVGYGMHGVKADGNEPIDLHLLARDLINDIRKNPRPVLLECVTMRMRGHGEHDDCSYVTPELLDDYSKRDPIAIARKRLVAEGVLTEKEIEKLDAECQAEVSSAYRVALAEPVPPPETLLEGVYAEE
jgi:TPP-dependent pyruvate/acetoin dehydrogenase alpha subunit